MSDPHVVYLMYHNITSDYVVYRNPPPVSWSTPIFNGELSDGLLTCKMKEHFASVHEARDAVEPYLRAWEIQAALRGGIHDLQFEYDKAEIIDRDPTPGIVELSGNSLLSLTSSATLAVLRNKYPSPPSNFQIKPDIESIWLRYRRYREGSGEPLQSMAYFCLTVAELDAGGGRGRVCAKYQIDKLVRSKLGDLTSDAGDSTEARKRSAKSTGQPLTGAEKAWIEAVLKELMLRMGEYDPSQPKLLLTMNDLPSLT